MAACLRRLGAVVDLAAGDGSLTGTVTGPLHEPDDVLDCGNSGTALRLLAGVVAGIDGLSVLTGDASLRQPPGRPGRAPLLTGWGPGSTPATAAIGRPWSSVAAGSSRRPTTARSRAPR
jgi:hypothetical protein